MNDHNLNMFFFIRSGNSTECCADFYIKDGECTRRYI